MSAARGATATSTPGRGAIQRTRPGVHGEVRRVIGQATILVLLVCLSSVVHAEASGVSLFGFELGATYPVDARYVAKREFGSLQLIEVDKPAQARDLDLVTLLVSRKSNTIVGVSARLYSNDPAHTDALLERFAAQLGKRYGRENRKDTRYYGSDSPLDREVLFNPANDHEFRLGTKNLGLRGGQGLHMFTVGLLAAGELFDRLTTAAARETYGARQ